MYLDGALINNGAHATYLNFTTQLYIDGLLKTSWTATPLLNINTSFTYAQDFNLGSLKAGTHALKAKVDSMNNVLESNETDNEYTKTVYVGALGQMQSPAPGSTFTSSSVTFAWTAGTANSYQLYVGNTLGGHDIYSSGQVSVLSKTVSNLPVDGRTIYVRLWSLIGITWYARDYTYHAL